MSWSQWASGAAVVARPMVRKMVRWSYHLFISISLVARILFKCRPVAVLCAFFGIFFPKFYLSFHLTVERKVLPSHSEARCASPNNGNALCFWEHHRAPSPRHQVVGSFLLPRYCALCCRTFFAVLWSSLTKDCILFCLGKVYDGKNRNLINNWQERRWLQRCDDARYRAAVKWARPQLLRFSFFATFPTLPLSAWYTLVHRKVAGGWYTKS